MTRPGLFLAAFFLLNIFLSSYFLDAWLTPNAAARALPVLTLHESRSLIIDKYERFSGDKALVGGHYYSDKAPLSTFLVYPFYALYRSLSSAPDNVDRINRHPIYIWEEVGIADGRAFLLPALNVPLLLGSFLCGSLPFALLVTATFLSIQHARPPVSPVVLAMLSAYGTFLFVLSGTYFGHLLSGVFLLAAYVLLRKGNGFLVAGLLTGFAFLTEYTSAIAAPIWACLILYNTRSIRKAGLFAAGTVPAVLFVLWFNTIITGNMFDLPYNHEALEAFSGMSQQLGFRGPSVESVTGLLFSTYRGLFFYAPILALIAWYSARMAFRLKWRCLTNNYVLLFVLASFLVNASYYMWWGGWSFGPRHLAPAAMLALFEGVIYLSAIRFSRLAFALLTGFGLVLAWGAKATRIYMMPDDPSRFANPLASLIVPDLAQKKFNANSLPTILADVSPQLSAYLWLPIFAGCLVLLHEWHRRLVSTRVAQGTLAPVGPVAGTRRKAQRATSRRRQ